MVEEVDLTGSLNESLHQIARRVQREDLSEAGRDLLEGAARRLDDKLAGILTSGTDSTERVSGRDRGSAGG